MRRNRFEQVDEPPDDAITLSITIRDGQDRGTIYCPAGLTAGRLKEDVQSAEMAGIEAFRSAIRLANEIKAPIVVIDPDRAWNTDWGDLYRADDPTG